MLYILENIACGTIYKFLTLLQMAVDRSWKARGSRQRSLSLMMKLCTLRVSAYTWSNFKLLVQAETNIFKFIIYIFLFKLTDIIAFARTEIFKLLGYVSYIRVSGERL